MQPSIIIVGAGPNLGAAIARRFGGEGLAVGLVARDAGKLATLADDLAAQGITAAYGAADIRDPSALSSAITSLTDRLGQSKCSSTRPCPPQSS